MVIDPFDIKKHPKWHPQRLWYTLRARSLEAAARRNYAKYELPTVRPDTMPAVPNADWANTDVQPEQLQLLHWALEQTEPLGGSIVEVGAYRGVTASFLAGRTSRRYFAVDPYIGYGGSETDLQQLQQRTNTLTNFSHLRLTSGKAAATWSNGPISLMFIDAVHDYVNVRFDIAAWLPHLCRDGIMAFHDTDLPNFAGVRRAIHEVVPPFELVGHVPNLVVLKKLIDQ